MRVMRLNKILVVGCLLLGVSAASQTESLAQAGPSAAGTFARTATQITDTNKAAEARKYLSLANSKIAQQPNNDSYYFGRSSIYRDLHDYQSSLTDIDHAIKLNPLNQSYYVFRASVRAKLLNYSAALSDINKAIAIGPESAELFGKRASALHLLRQYDESLVAANRSISLDPKSAETYAARGITKFYLRDYRGARLDCNKAASLEPGNLELTRELRHLLDKATP